MRKPLPPLSSLRSFEAVARQLSFSKAAEELHVTPGAVSQQIRGLEELLGAKLFDRTRRWVALTDIAVRMLPDIQAGLDSLSRACSSKVVPAGERTLTISVASLAFCLLGSSALLLALSLGPRLRTRNGRVGWCGLLAIGAAFFIAGIFPPVQTPVVSGYLHGIAGLVAIFGSPIAFTDACGLDRILVLSRFSCRSQPY
jgi:predicted transcriptional regulator